MRPALFAALAAVALTGCAGSPAHRDHDPAGWAAFVSQAAAQASDLDLCRGALGPTIMPADAWPVARREYLRRHPQMSSAEVALDCIWANTIW
jgi:hypothetical protein